MPVRYDAATRTYTDMPATHVSDMRTNLPDRAARGPGFLFKTIDAAATDAMDYIRSTMKPQFVEYGGWVVKVPGGFTYREIIGPGRDAQGRGSTPGSVSLGEPPADAVASFHTHPRRGAESLYAGSDEFFSDGDRASAKYDLRKGIAPASLYLSTPYGRVRRYDPSGDRSTTVRGPALQGEGRGGE